MFKSELQLIKNLNCDELEALKPKRVSEEVVREFIDDKDCFKE